MNFNLKSYGRFFSSMKINRVIMTVIGHLRPVIGQSDSFKLYSMVKVDKISICFAYPAVPRKGNISCDTVLDN